jgi:HSP20 family molecular chaperone IbpA
VEYIKVTVPGNENDDIDVLINGEKNGKTSETIILGSSGFVFISVDLPGAEEKTVDVNNTTAEHPMHIEVTV